MYRTVVICFLILLLGCRGESPGPQEKQPLSNPLEQEDSLVNLSIPKVVGVNFYLENSHSMGGYYGHSSRFYDMVDGLVTDLMIDDFELKTNTIAESVENYESPEDFRTALNPTNDTEIAIGKSSPLAEILQQVFEESDPYDLNILVTDGIISGSNEQIEQLKKKNKDYNLEYIASLVNDIKLGLSEYVDQFETKIYAFKSDFEASYANPYYKLDNSKITKGVFPNRPYYILVIGAPKVMDKFEEKYNKKIAAQQVLEFGFIPEIADVVKLPRLAFTKACRVNGNSLIMEESKSTFNFSILLNLVDFPSQYQNTEFLAENIELLNDRGFALENVLIDVYPLSQLPTEVAIFRKDSRVEKETKGYTHVLSINLSDYNPSGQDAINLIFKKNYQDWYKTWSSTNDLNINMDDDKTFGFEHFVKGIIGAYGGMDNPIYEKTIKIETN
jgi:hypothetical protein